jgi:molybdopterin synthase sulfur carrier subunit
MPSMLPMPRISSTDHGLLALTGGQASFEVPAGSVLAALKALDARYPGLLQHVESGMAVAIDGLIHQDGWLEPIGPDSEVVLIPRISGG